VGFVHADRVKETTTTTGTGAYSLAGAATGFRTFVAGIGNGNRCTYCVTDGTSWEINEGVVTDATPDTLTRDKLLASSSGSAINWGAGTRDVFCVYAAAQPNPQVKHLSAAHTLASATGTEVTGLEFVDLRPGVYLAEYFLRCSSSATGTGIGLGINFTGTAASPSILLRAPTTGAAAATGVYDGEANVGTGSLYEARATNAYSTTAPNMLNTGGVAVANEVIQIVITALITVTAAGNLELWHSSETAANTSVLSGSVARLTRMD
jgi:hypothetical protein